MLALRWSYAKDLFLVGLLGVTTLVAQPPCRTHAVDRAAPPHSVHVALVRPIKHVDYCAMAELRYQKREFVAAAFAMKQAARTDPSLAAQAELYDQFDRAWRTSSSIAATSSQRFEALRYARRLDVSLGGVWGSEIDAKLRHIAPLAVFEYRRAANQEGLELALATCDALGVHDL